MFFTEKYDKIYEQSSKVIAQSEIIINNAEKSLKQANTNIINSQLQVNEGIVNISATVAVNYNSSNIYQRVLERKNSISYHLRPRTWWW